MGGRTDGARVLIGRRHRGAPAGPPLDAAGPGSHEPNPDRPETLREARLFAIVKTWMDEDVIEATVRNALVQGAEKVFVVDNGSTDATLELAKAAGATIAEVYRSEAFDGPLAQALANAVVARESLRCGADHVWWLYLDSDEFPEGPTGLSVRDYLDTLDRRFRVVGSTHVNHLPSEKPEYLAGFHPIDFQPLCYTFVPSWTPACGLSHWKHPLQRFDRRGPFVVSRAGAHWAFCAEDLLEPSTGIVIHHFQYREEATTRSKLQLTCGPGPARTALYGTDGVDGFSRRRRSLDAVYAQRWEAVETEVHRTLAGTGEPRPWPGVADVRRWYTPDELGSARSAWTRTPRRAAAEAP
jgi:glycosyl transferase family 2